MLFLLLIGISPVEYGVVGELVVCKRLERCAGKMKGEFPLDPVKGNIGFECINAFMCFVYYKHIPDIIFDFF